MKKFVRFIIVFAILAIVILLSLGLYEPQDIVVSRSTVIAAPKEVIFDQIRLFKNWTNWSPWYMIDTAMKITYNGTDGTSGSSYVWKGDENKTGAGEMKNTGIEGTTMNFEVAFTSPREGKATGYLKAQDTAGKTKVTWSFSMHIGFPFNAMCAFMNMDKMMGGDFENGLANLKKYVEAHNTPTQVIEVKEVDFAAHVYEGMRQTVAMSDFQKFFGESYARLGKELGPKITGPGVGLFYTWDTTLKNSDMAAVFPVTDTSKPVAGAVILHAGPGKAYMAVQKGGYSISLTYHAAIMKKIAEKGLKQGLVIEEYIVGPHEQADSSKWVTNIYYMVQ